MSAQRQLEYTSDLGATPAEVWARVACMAGVNAELAPWLRMTTPAGVADLRLEQAPLGVPLFSSCVMFLGLVPVDVHRFQLLEVRADDGFVEQSTSWTERRWRHERTLEPLDGGGGCRLRDRLTFTPRLALMAPLLVPIVDATFRHRHAQLRRTFGGMVGQAA